MPFISLDLKCTMVGVTDLKPSEPDSFRWYIKVKCTSCGEFSDKWQYVTSNEVLEVPGSRGEANMVMKCKLCSRVNTLSILPESFGKYSLEKNEQWQSLLAFDSRGLEIVDFDPRLAWEATGAETNQPFNDIDLSEKIWADYDEKAGEAVEITNIEVRFSAYKPKK